MSIRDEIKSIWAQPKLANEDYLKILSLLQNPMTTNELTTEERLHIAQDILASVSKTAIAEETGKFILEILNTHVLAKYIEPADKFSALAGIINHGPKEGAAHRDAVAKITHFLDDPEFADLYLLDRVEAARYVMRATKGEDENRERTIARWVKEVVAMNVVDPKTAVNLVDREITFALSQMRSDDAAGLTSMREMMTFDFRTAPRPHPDQRRGLTS